MAVYSKIALSGSTNGRPILITQAATAGTAIHTASTVVDEVWIWAWNSNASAQLFTVEYGGVTDPNDILEITLPVNTAGSTLVVPGWIATGSIAIAGFAANANEVTIFGYVNRIT